MKVRIGFGLGGSVGVDGASFAHVVDELERLGYDSLWVSERVNSPTFDPLVAMTHAAARTDRLKVGASVMVLPGRNPVLLAKAIASLDVLSNGRALPAFGLGVANSAEHQAFGVERKQRAGLFDEALPLLRQIWDKDNAVVEHRGTHFVIDEVSVLPKPVQQPLEVWLGGAHDSELRRVGRLADGWLPSFITPANAAEGRAKVEAEAAAHGREIDPEHWGALIPYVSEGQASGDSGDQFPEALVAFIRTRYPDAEPADVVARGPKGAAELVERFTEVGFSKFVFHPFGAPEEWTELLEALAAETFPLQT
jgi:probable F420-dependent oxidoreductase